MLTDFLYDHSMSLVGPLIVAAFIALSLAGLVAFVKLVPHRSRQEHNELTGFVIAAVGVVQAVLLAFIAVAALETFNKASDIADREASLVSDIYQDSKLLPEPLSSRAAGHIRNYLETVVHDEWPGMAKGSINRERGWEELRGLHADLARFRSDEAAEIATFSETLRRLNELYDARRPRLRAAEERLNPVVWGVVLAGSALTIAFTWLFGMGSLRMHMVMTGSVAAAIGLVVALIVAFDVPFRGEVQVSSEIFASELERVSQAIGPVAER